MTLDKAEKSFVHANWEMLQFDESHYIATGN